MFYIRRIFEETTRIARMELFWIPLILTTLLLKVVESSGSSQCIDKSTEYGDKYCQAIRIDCPDDSVIYKPDITASSVECDVTTNTSLEGIPVDLVVEISQCYWKRSCIIGFPISPIFAKTRLEDVKSLRVNGWQCLKQQDIEDNTFFTESICKGNESISTTHPERGIIISHSTIPWNYDNELLKGPVPTKQKMVCRKVLHVRPHIEEKYLLTIDLFDIDEDSDTLFINDRMVVDKQFRKISNSDDITSITFTIIRWSKGGSGFVICYKKLTAGERVTKSTSACESILKRSNARAILTRANNEYCKNDVHQPDIDSNSQKYSSTAVTPPAENMNKKQRGNKCSKCLTKQKTITKCKQKCCTTPPFHRECPSTDSRPPTITINKQEGTNKGKCKLNTKQIAKRCKKCQIGITRCNGKYKRMCPDCCPGKNILAKCKPRRGRRKKGRKSKGKTNNKSGSQKNKKGQSKSTGSKHSKD